MQNHKNQVTPRCSTYSFCEDISQLLKPKVMIKLLLPILSHFIPFHNVSDSISFRSILILSSHQSLGFSLSDILTETVSVILIESKGF
jgi:hypothetical protein